MKSNKLQNSMCKDATACTFTKLKKSSSGRIYTETGDNTLPPGEGVERLENSTGRKTAFKCVVL